MHEEETEYSFEAPGVTHGYGILLTLKVHEVMVIILLRQIFA